MPDTAVQEISVTIGEYRIYSPGIYSELFDKIFFEKHLHREDKGIFVQFSKQEISEAERFSYLDKLCNMEGVGIEQFMKSHNVKELNNLRGKTTYSNPPYFALIKYNPLSSCKLKKLQDALAQSEKR